MLFLNLNKPQNPMNIDHENILLHKIEIAANRINVLYENAAEITSTQPQFLMQCLEELSLALEELHIAEEELHLKNNELAEAWQIAERERQRYQELFEFAPDGYLVTDTYGRIQEANHAAAELFNISPKYLINKLVINFVPEESRRNFRLMLNQLPKINRIQEWEICLCKRDKQSFYASLTVETVRNQQDQVISLRWLLRDITTRKQAEEELHQTQLQNLQLIEADRLKTQFISTISHELRTPLNAILGFSNLLLRRMQNQHDECLVGMVERIFNNGKNLLKLIEEILDFSKLEARRINLQQDTFDLADLGITTCDELRVLAQQKALELEVKAIQRPITIVNDRLRLRQILVNLLSNGIKFTEKGCVSLEIGELPNDRVVIIVQDTGIGINLTDQPHIFKEFWQANQTINRPHNGAGLGLAITGSLVELMQGSITVESQPGKGTTFRVELPRRIG